MSDIFLAEPAAIDKLIGIYIDEKNKEDKTEFFKKDNVLWSKNEIYGINLNYIGDNKFQYPGLTMNENLTFHFEIMADGTVKLTQTYINGKGEKESSVAMKVK